MKKPLFLAMTVAVLALPGCSPASGSADTGASTQSPNASTPASTPAPTEFAVTITVNGTAVSGRLHENAATTSLLNQLPLELSFEDYGAQEKHAALPAPLALDAMPSGSSAEAGVIGYYAPGQALVLYYDTVGYFEGIILLGTFDDIAAVRNAAAFVGIVAAG